MIVVAGVLLLAGVAFFARVVRAPFAEHRFRRHARSAEGEVLRVRSKVVRKEDGWHDEVLADVPVVRFTLPDGRVVETEAFEWRDDSPPPGSPVDLRYDDRDPTVARLAGGGTARFQASVTAVMSAFGLVVGGLFVLVVSLAG